MSQPITTTALVARRRIETLRRGSPLLTSDDILIEVEQCGVCAGDVDQWLGRANNYPTSLGHEVCGFIVDAGSSVDHLGLAVGDRVSAWVPGGGMSSHVLAKSHSAFRVSPFLKYPSLMEPVACCINAIGIASPQDSDRIVVLGDGFMGQIIARLLALTSRAQVVVASSHADSSSHPVVGDNVDEIVSAFPHGSDIDIVFEATGRQDSLDLMGKLAKMEGKIVFAGYHQGGNRRVDLAHWNYMAFQILNGHMRSQERILQCMRKAREILTANEDIVEDLVTHSFSLADVGAALELGATKPPGYTKAIILPGL